MDGLLGRTNAHFPRTWLALQQPQVGDAEALVESAIESKTVLEITSQPALWGGLLRGSSAPVAVTIGRNLWQCDRAETATAMIMGELLQMLSCLGREELDIVFLRLERRLEEFQLNGALEALELNRQDGMIKNLGLAAHGQPFAVLAMWQFHDAFDLCLLPPDAETQSMLASLAAERRVGVVTSVSLEQLLEARASSHVLVPVRSAGQAEVAMRENAVKP